MYSPSARRGTHSPAVADHIASADLARSFGQRTHQLAWLLGAGCSASAGVPTASDMVLDLKKRLYCAATRTVLQEVDVSDPLWAERITTHFDDSKGFPPSGDPQEYAAAFEAAFPEALDRRSYVSDAVKRGTPSYAHRVLASMISSGLVRCVFTTNFDSLVERATAVTDDLLPPEGQAHLTVGTLDTVERAERCVREASWPLLVKLHGDYQSERLKNIPKELRSQDDRLRRVFIEALRRFGLVVVGYSGRDDSIMDALEEAVSVDSPMPAGLWWVARPDSILLPRVASLLELAATSGVEVHLVNSENFDELAGDIEREVDLPKTLRQHVQRVRPKPLVVPVDLTSSRSALFPAVRCSALELLGVPDKAREVTLDRPISTAEARRVIKAAGVWATVVSLGQRLLVFGPDDGIEQAFAASGGKLGPAVPLNPTENSSDLGLLYDAFARAVVRGRSLRPLLSRRGHTAVVLSPDTAPTPEIARARRATLSDLQSAYRDALTGLVPRIDCSFAEAIRLRIELRNRRWWFVYEPYTWVDLPRLGETDQPASDPSGHNPASPQSVPKDIAADWRRERWARRYNAHWNEIIAAWAKLIAPKPETDLGAHSFEGEGVNAVFRVSGTTAWSSPTSPRGDPSQ